VPKGFNKKMKDQIEKVVRYTITLPLTLSIKMDIERKKLNLNRSAWIRMQLEKNIMKTSQVTLKDIQNEIKELKEAVKNRERV
jgi:DNA mismatch repair ATPase MutS